MVPENHGKRGEYAGAVTWGSSPPIDARRSLVFVATGNLYSAPPRIRRCQEKENNQTVPSQPDECVEPDNPLNSILAVDLDSGKIRWYCQLGGYDVWFFACNNISTSPDCPPGPNPDADFGDAPMMLIINDVNKTKRDVVVAVQKSGFGWALDCDNGNPVWSTEAGPGGLGGGGIWGAATDDQRLYTISANPDHKNFTVKPSSHVTTAGGWVAVDAKYGKILWSSATSSGPVTVANGVVFAGSTHPKGPVYALDTRIGEVLWSYETGATVFGGVSVSNGSWLYFTVTR